MPVITEQLGPERICLVLSLEKISDKCKNERDKQIGGGERKPMINSKFWPLADYLKALNMSRTILTFEEIESILEFPLCKSAQIYKAYWHPSATHTLPNVCLEAGYEITDIDLKSKKVCFEK